MFLGLLFFEATDIDTPLEELTAYLINGLGSGVPLDVYSCLDSSDQVLLYPLLLTDPPSR